MSLVLAKTQTLWTARKPRVNKIGREVKAARNYGGPLSTPDPGESARGDTTSILQHYCVP